MVLGATGAYRVALECAEPGRRLAGVGDDRSTVLWDCVDVRARQGCDAAHPLREVQSGALRGEQGTRASLDHPKGAAALAPAALRQPGARARRRMDPLEHAKEHG